MLDEHLAYVADVIRLAQFQSAIAKVINGGERIADLGCGSGILGLLCLQAGAGHVYAIDSTTMLEVARKTFSRAGWKGQATFIRGHSHRVELPEAVDLVICDHVGYFGFDYDIVHTIQDARRRLLKSGGSLVPARIRLQLAAVESEGCREKVEGWRAAGVPAAFHWLREHEVNAKHPVELGPDAILGQPAELGEINLRADHPDFFSWVAELHIERAGVMHGLAGWFECELAEGVWMTNSPLADRRINRSQAFFPIGEAVPVRSGDLVKARIMARPADHLIAWTLEFPASGQRFRHSTWQGMLLSPEDLLRSRPERVPHLSREGRARIAVLNYCDGRCTAREIEQAVLREHPDLFPSPTEISRFVLETLGRNTE